MDALWAEFNGERAQAEAKALNQQATRMGAEALRSYAAAGLSSIEMLAAAESCPACSTVAGRVFAIADAPRIPVIGCTNTFCRCDYLPVIG